MRRDGRVGKHCLLLCNEVTIMERFTWPELTDMHLAYGAAHSNAAEAARLYAVRFPNRELPDRRFFQRLDLQMREGRLMVSTKTSVTGYSETIGTWICDSELSRLRIESVPDNGILGRGPAGPRRSGRSD